MSRGRAAEECEVGRFRVGRLRRVLVRRDDLKRHVCMYKDPARGPVQAYMCSTPASHSVGRPRCLPLSQAPRARRIRTPPRRITQQSARVADAAHPQCDRYAFVVSVFRRRPQRSAVAA